MDLPIISLFSGAGGLDLGFETAGFKPLVAYDIFKPAVETYNYNRQQSVAHLADVSSLEAKQIIEQISGVYGPDVKPVGIIGGPPCQAFSRSNLYPRDDDKRRTLPGRYAQLLKALNDFYELSFFVFENVQGLTFERHTEEFAHFRYLFSEAGFHLYEKLLNAKHYGVPQDRPRVLIVGFNTRLFKETVLDEYNFNFPQPTSDRPKTVYEAFTDVFGTPPWPEPAFYDRSLSPEDIPFHPNHWTMVPRSKKFTNGYLKAGEVKSRSFRVLSWDKPSWTVAYGNREIHVHPSAKRRLSIFEAMILQGFPVEYVLKGTLSAQVTLVSDAVPPPLAFHLAKAIRAYLERQKNWSLATQYDDSGIR